ncbi:NAD-dependent protein deacetylase Sirt2 [Gryllus bimaculatus]|nr:NAD-dependent protein deacetylase Sirt2 [Gryllus bimaculatus]
MSSKKETENDSSQSEGDEKAGASSVSAPSSSNVIPKDEHTSESSDDEGGSTIEMLRRYMVQKLGLHENDDAEERKPKILDDVSIHGVINFIKDGKCKKIITMAGAGISTSSGIPDFRSPGSGLYDNLAKYNLPHPTAIFEIGFFRENPKPFFALAKELYPGVFKPTPCHYFLKLLNEKGLLLRHYTQNIDTLERVAGLPGEKLIEAHGTFHTSHCLGCRKSFEQEWVKEHVFSDSVPKCDECNDIVKPDIVFFGENLPHRFYISSQQDFPQCDLLIIMGSSLTVEPFASLIEQVPKNCPRLLINRTKAGQRSSVMAFLGMGSGLDFDAEGNTRDVAWLGDCDDGCLELARGLGWEEELRKLIADGHAGIDTSKTLCKDGDNTKQKNKNVKL